MTITRMLAAAIIVSVIHTDLLAQDNPEPAETFKPQDLDDLEMFLESVKGLAVATSISQDAYQATGENTP